MILSYLFAFLLFLCWGSFLNVVGYRIIRGYSFLGRSYCPHCRTHLSWYDLIPLISYASLRGRCRTCRNVISPLYPLIELMTAIILTLMIIFIKKHYWFGYGLFISAGMVTIRTDFEKMLISRYVTWGLIPIAFIMSYNDMLPLTLSESVQGAAFGYLVLFVIAYLFHAIRNIEGMGEGDIDLLGMIGSFIGITGAWTSLLLGSLLGIISCLVQMAISKRAHPKIAFGPWLAIGSFIYIFFQQKIQEYIQPLI